MWRIIGATIIGYLYAPETRPPATHAQDDREEQVAVQASATYKAVFRVPDVKILMVMFLRMSTRCEARRNADDSLPDRYI